MESVTTSSVREAALVFVGSAGICVLIGHLAIHWITRAGWIQPVRYEDCPPLQSRQHAKEGTPTMGGLLVLTVAVLFAAVTGGLSAPSGWIVLFAVVSMAALGVVDDLRKFRGANAIGLRTGPKLVAALVIGGLVGVGLMMGDDTHRLIDVPWAHRAVDLGWAIVPFAMMVVTGCAHAVNLTDGMDGLAVGCVAIALVTLGLWALTDARFHVLVPWCAGLAGACAGFLWFNSYPAAVFLGDVGALGLGGALAVISLLTHSALWLVLIGGVFVMEALSVMLQVASYKWRGGRRIFRVAPIHHHFHLGGLSEPKVIVRFWIVGMLLAALSLTAMMS